MLLLGTSALIGGVYPALVQQLQVRPTEVDKESPYITRSIDATRSAYGIADASIQQYQAVSEATTEALAASAGTIASIRLLDPTVVAPTFEQLEQNRGYYQFPDTLDVDRYTIDGKQPRRRRRGPRAEPDGLPDGSATGPTTTPSTPTATASSPRTATSATADGKPRRSSQSEHPADRRRSASYQPRIYFGEESPRLLDRRRARRARTRSSSTTRTTTTEQGRRTYTYTGSGGVADRQRCRTGCCTR